MLVFLCAAPTFARQRVVEPTETAQVPAGGRATWAELLARESAAKRDPPPPIVDDHAPMPMPFPSGIRHSPQRAQRAQSWDRSGDFELRTVQLADAPRGGGLAPFGIANPIITPSFLAILDNATRIPPDTNGAVGPMHVMTMLNSQVRIHSRAGDDLGIISLARFFSPLNRPAFDPHLLYDAPSGRWIACADAGSRSVNSRVFFAISDTSDPTGAWTYYEFLADAAGVRWADYPGFGVNSRWIAITNNLFPIAVTDPPTTSGVKMWVIDKNTALVPGGTITVSVFNTGFDEDPDLGPTGLTLAPAHHLDASDSGPLYLAKNTFRFDEADGTFLLAISRLEGTPSAPVWMPMENAFMGDTGLVKVPTNFGALLRDAPQLGDPNRIETNDARMMNAVVRHGRLWFAHMGGLPASPDPMNPMLSERTGVFWYQLNPSAFPSPITQSGVLDDGPDTHLIFPSISVNEAGDALLGFSRADATRYVEAAAALKEVWRFGAFGPVFTLKSGEDSYFKTLGTGRNRWGDYSATIVDPADGRSFWTIQEYAALDVGPSSIDDRWSTWWSRVTPDCTNDSEPDYEQILNKNLRDTDGNFIPDSCECPGDWNRDGVRSLADLAVVILNWEAPFKMNELAETINQWGIDCDIPQ